MTIISAEAKPCVQRQSDAGWTFARAAIPDIRGWTIILTDDAGRTGLGYGHALPTVTANSETTKAALDFLLPKLIGRDGSDIAAIVHEVDVALAAAPAAKAGIDMALHDLLARKLNVPLNVLFGGAMRKSIPQGRIVPLKQPKEMAEHAAKLAAEGYPMIKVKFSGDAGLDAARIAAVRDAVGPKPILTVDTNQTYSAKGFINTFGRIEQYDIKLVEQPVIADDWQGLALCTRTLPVAVEADESAGSLADVAKLVNGRMCDVINLKVTKLGGIRNTLKAVALCEANGIGCRLGAAFGPSLLQAVSAHIAAAFTRLEYPCELAEHLHLLDDPFTPLPVESGRVTVPTSPGSGVALASLA
jgi:L-alanine-DL-glutamate epimerase-like enolase superfamily enzyme